MYEGVWMPASRSQHREHEKRFQASRQKEKVDMVSGTRKERARGTWGNERSPVMEPDIRGWCRCILGIIDIDFSRLWLTDGYCLLPPRSQCHFSASPAPPPIHFPLRSLLHQYTESKSYHPTNYITFLSWAYNKSRNFAMSRGVV